MLILLLSQNVGANVVVWTARVDSILVQVVCSPTSQLLANGQLIVIIIVKLVIIARVDIA